ncbi:MAG TPA: PAS domain S-box protein [Syntrophorhabdaceae bacterium]|nr:PAS domain S-box protein [Syntrophorhabdaceae bacterium]
MNDYDPEKEQVVSSGGDDGVRVFFDTPPDAAFIMDSQGTLITLNENLARRFNHDVDEMVGSNIFDYFSPDVARSRKALMERIITGRRPLSCTDFRDGVWLESCYYPVLDRSGSVAKIAVFSRDVTAVRRAEEALRESEERYRTAIENSNDGVAILKGNIHLYVNGKFVEIFGYDSPADIIGKPQSLTVHPDDYRRVVDFTQRRQRGEIIPERYEFKGVKRNGDLVYIEVSATGTTYRGENVALVYMRDVTARRTSEEELWLARFSIEHASESIFWIRPDGRFVYVNEAACNKLGYRKEELLALRVVDVDPDHTKRELSAIGRCMAEEGSITFRSHHQAKNGRTFPVEVIANHVAYSGEDFIFCFARDVSDKELAEERLNAERQKFQILIEHAPFGMAMFDREDRYLYVNPKFTEIFGYTLAEIPDRASWFERAYPDGAVRESVTDAWHHDDGTKDVGEKMPRTFPVVCKDGATKLINFITVRLENGDYIVSFEDITERRLAEQALANEKERLAVTLRSIGDGVIATDSDGRIVLMNAVAEELTGWKQEEATGTDLVDVFHIINERTRARCESPVDKVLRMGTVVGLANHTALISKDGRELVIADSGAPIWDRDGNIAGVVLVFRDVTEKKRMDEELQKMSKLESVGILAGGIAHDFNNILAAILGNVSLARMYAEPADERVLKRLEDAEQAVLRAKDLTLQLLTFSKGGSPILKTTSIENVVRETASFALTGSGVRCDFMFAEDLFPVDIDEGQMSQVINNLVINSQQAMSGGGVITIEAVNLAAPDEMVEHGVLLQPGSYVRISVKDRGTGIAPEHVHKVFDPYFTTKDKGSGLGLATSYSIIKNHDGHITLDSEPGSGTTFFIYLKASRRRAPSVVRSVRDNRITTVRARILHMDDEAMILKTTKEMLEGLGYDVACAADGREAIARFREAAAAGTPFDVVLLDITVPGGLGGKGTMRELVAIDPGVRVIVSSGYSNDPVLADHRKHGFKGVLAKPCLMSELDEIIRRVLEEG